MSKHPRDDHQVELELPDTLGETPYYSPFEKIQNILLEKADEESDDEESDDDEEDTILANDSEKDKESKKEDMDKDLSDSNSATAEAKSESFEKSVIQFRSLIEFYTSQSTADSDASWVWTSFSEARDELQILIQSKQNAHLTSVFFVQIKPIFDLLQQSLEKQYNQKIVLIIAHLLYGIVNIIDLTTAPAARFDTAINAYTIACNDMNGWLALDKEEGSELLRLMSINLDLFGNFSHEPPHEVKKMLTKTTQVSSLVAKWVALADALKTSLKPSIYCKTQIDAYTFICQLPSHLKQQQHFPKANQVALYQKCVTVYEKFFAPLKLDDDSLRFHLDTITSMVFWYQAVDLPEILNSLEALLTRCIKILLQTPKIEKLFEKLDEYTISLVNDTFASAIDMREAKFYKPLGKLKVAVKKTNAAVTDNLEEKLSENSSTSSLTHASTSSMASTNIGGENRKPKKKRRRPGQFNSSFKPKQLSKPKIKVEQEPSTQNSISSTAKNEAESKPEELHLFQQPPFTLETVPSEILKTDRVITNPRTIKRVDNPIIEITPTPIVEKNLTPPAPPVNRYDDNRKSVKKLNFDTVKKNLDNSSEKKQSPRRSQGEKSSERRKKRRAELLKLRKQKIDKATAKRKQQTEALQAKVQNQEAKLKITEQQLHRCNAEILSIIQTKQTVFPVIGSDSDNEKIDSKNTLKSVTGVETERSVSIANKNPGESNLISDTKPLTESFTRSVPLPDMPDIRSKEDSRTKSSSIPMEAENKKENILEMQLAYLKGSNKHLENKLAEISQRFQGLQQILQEVSEHHQILYRQNSEMMETIQQQEKTIDRELEEKYRLYRVIAQQNAKILELQSKLQSPVNLILAVEPLQSAFPPAFTLEDPSLNQPLTLEQPMVAIGSAPVSNQQHYHASSNQFTLMPLPRPQVQPPIQIASPIISESQVITSTIEKN